MIQRPNEQSYWNAIWRMLLARWTLDREVALLERLPMTVDLASDVEKFLRERLRSTPSVDANELVNDILRSVGKLQQRRFEVTPELEEWLLASADSVVTPLTSGDFEGIRERVRARTSTAGS
jgi:hypothetical protein